MLILNVLIWICVFEVLINAVSIDNGIEGSPQVTCGDTFVSIHWQTRNPFEGYIFVREHFGDAACRTGENDTARRDVEIKVPFTACGVRKTRSGNPRGVYVSLSVVVSFHPRLVTKNDRIYIVQCFYMEAVKVVTAELEVSMLTTSLQTQVVPMPICRYEVLEGGLNGAPVKYAKIGDPVYHKWSCDTDTVDTFCMIVHSCTVDDGQGNSVPLIDPNGCAQDKYLLGNLEYVSDLMAGKESHVFKYADRPSLYFNCQVSIGVREPDQQCPKPQCPEPKRGKRSSDTEANNPVGNGTLSATGNVSTADPESAVIIDVALHAGQISKDRTGLFTGASNPAISPRKGGMKKSEGSQGDVCMSLQGFSSYAAMNALMTIVSISLLVISYKRCAIRENKP